MVMPVIVMVVLGDDCTGVWNAGDGRAEVVLLRRTAGTRRRNERRNRACPERKTRPGRLITSRKPGSAAAGRPPATPLQAAVSVSFLRP
ncbi:hypothetical protein E2C01_045158 [Portunus trituberculatus]|uniref:Uncharacterized protein n=1 Tax=Portunus trituberculatus TaxID=210409 RepID=A0A5B7FXJ0_PORTR|nr:hypothetical protein [Portunus trituberculatus]